MDQEKWEAYLRIPVLRHEAGEGWHPDGLNEVVLGAIATREYLSDLATEQGVHFPSPDNESYRVFRDAADKVDELKQSYGIASPSYRPEEYPGGTE